MDTPQWEGIVSGVWRLQIGERESLTPLSLAGGTPRLETLQNLPAPPLSATLQALGVELKRNQTLLRLSLSEGEALFGLGLQFFRVNHRGRTRFLRVNSDPRQDTGESHAPIPFLVSSAGYGILINTARIVTFCCGSVVRKESPVVVRDRGRDADWEPTPTSPCLEVVVGSEDIEVLVFTGENVGEVVQRYNLYCGGGTLPPRWGLGFWHRVHYQHTDSMALEEAREFRTRGYPCDVIGLEPGWHTKSYPCSFEWASDRFPDPARFVKEMQEEGFQINLWEHGYVSPEASIFPKLDAYAGSHTVWGGIAPDFTLPEAQAILKEQHDKDHVSIGVSGYKLDECDGSELTGASWMFPAHATFPSGADGEQMRQVYGLALQKLTYELYQKHNRRTYGLVRASNAGASPLPYVLYSDLYNHREFVRALCNSGFSGILWTPEIRSAQNAEEWVRRMQVVCLSPLAMLNAWSDATKPWSFPEVEPIIYKFINLRMRLMPYLYSAFAKYYFEGIPPFRGMAFEQTTTPEEAALFAENGDQFLVGDSLLVAPVFEGEQWRDVALPAGDWFDFETGQRFEGGRTHRIYPSLETLPLFVRNGGIIPMMPTRSFAPKAGEAVPLEVVHYGNLPGSFALYDDDGVTFDYTQGAYRWHTLQVTQNAEGRLQGNTLNLDSEWRSSYSGVSWKFL